MEYGSAFGHGAYLGPDYTADYLRRSSNLVRQSYGGPPSDAAARKTIEDMRTNRYEAKTGTLTFSAAEAGAFRKLVPYYSRFFSDPNSEHGLRPERDHEPDAVAAADGVVCLDGLGRGGEAARPQLLLHEQLALRAAGRQHADGERDRLVGAVADRAPRAASASSSQRSAAPDQPASASAAEFADGASRVRDEHQDLELLRATRPGQQPDEREQVRTPRYVNDQSKQPSLDHDSRALNLARSPSADSRDEFCEPYGPPERGVTPGLAFSRAFWLSASIRAGRRGRHSMPQW
jgi:hypothetical protein